MTPKDLKKVNKLKERVATLESEMQNSLIKKSSSTVEISVSDYTRKIKELKLEISKFK